MNQSIAKLPVTVLSGFFWLATRPHFAGSWSQAGGMARYGAAGMFWKAIPEEQWPEEEEYREAIRSTWVEPFGDMRQELVFIGQGLNKTDIIQRLNACLLTEEQVLEGKDMWAQLPDPFPEWGY